jgi:ribonuclease D
MKKMITKEEINLLPLLNYEGELKLIETLPEALEAVMQLSGEKILGFDTETRPSFQKGESYPVALLQLATANSAYLFRLNKIPFLPEVRELLANPSILKVGVGIEDDLKGLQRIAPFKPEGFVDIAKEAKLRGYSGLGLRSLTAIFLGQRLSKAAKITNWEKNNLTEAQLKYAANDALVGLLIYQKLMNLPTY